MAPRNGLRSLPMKCCRGWQSATTRDATDAQRGGVIRLVTLLQIVPPARAVHCASVFLRDDTGTGTYSSMLELTIGVTFSGPEGQGTVVMWSAHDVTGLRRPSSRRKSSICSMLSVNGLFSLPSVTMCSISSGTTALESK